MSFQIGSCTQAWAQQSKLPCHFLTETASTNNTAKDLLSGTTTSAESIQLVVTNHQTAGRGRHQNQWQDSSGSTLLSSWIFQLPASPLPTTTCRLGLAVISALKTTWPWLELSLKAPNDLYLGNKKVGGILLENIQQGSHNQMIIGLGLNVFQHPEIEIATSLTAEMPNNPITEQNWHNFLDRLLLELSLAVTKSTQKLSLNDRSSLLFYLNLNPNLKEQYLSIDEDGSLKTSKKYISWMDL